MEPLVVFTETVHASPRGWKKMFQRRPEDAPSGIVKVIGRILRPWTWFWGDK